MVQASKVENNIRHFPLRWITPEENNVSEEAIKYMEPLIRTRDFTNIKNELLEFIQTYE